MSIVREWECSECGLMVRGFSPPAQCLECGESGDVFVLYEYDSDDEEWGESEDLGDETGVREDGDPFADEDLPLKDDTEFDFDEFLSGARSDDDDLFDEADG